MKVEKKNFLIDMDGVLIHGKRLIPGADEFINSLKAKEIKFLILTNNSIYTPIDLAHRLQVTGLDVEKSNIFTSAMAIHNAGYILTPEKPDFVVLGETFDYNFHQVTKAVQLILEGARFLATNPDPTGPTENGIAPACGAMAALIEKASGKSPFFLGKPNPFMIRAALNYLGVHSENTVMVGDRMDTDILSGIESGMDTILVLSGVTHLKMLDDFPYQPNQVVKSVADIEV
jgi:NagD protein